MQTRYKVLVEPRRIIYLYLFATYLGFSLVVTEQVYAQEQTELAESVPESVQQKQNTETTKEQQKKEVHQKQEAPFPNSRDIGDPAPLSRDIYPIDQLSKDKKRCKRKRGRWFKSEKGLEGCVIKGKKEGTWVFIEGEFIQGVLSFKADQFEGQVWSFSLEGKALELITYHKGKKDGVARKWGLGGQLKSVDYYKADQKNGPSFGWHARSCIPAHRGAYKLGKKHGPWVSWYQTGAYQEKGSYTEGVKQGLWSFYHQEGNKIKEGQMLDGKEQGMWQEWLHTGQKWRDSEFKDGVRQGSDELACLSENGTWLVDHKERVESCQRFGYQTIIAQKNYYETGALLRRDTYNLKGEKTGLTQSFHPTGEVLVEGQMIGGRPEGVFKYLKPSGEPMGPSSIINQGTGKWVAYHASGKVAEQGEWLLGYPQGLWQTFYDHGGLESTVVYKEGRRNGTYKRYYRDGTIELEGEFFENARQGTWKFYYTNGQVAVEAGFVDSVRSGPWKEWYWLSSPKVQGEYINNQKAGTWREFHNNGELSAQGNYTQDRKSGPWSQNWYTGSHWRDLEYTGGVSDDPDESQCESVRGKWTAELKERYAGCQVCRVLPDGSNKMVKVGAWRWWHPNGKLEREGQFDEDQAHGSWQEYNREGKLILSGEYDRGKRVGLWSGYYPEGPKQYEGRFDDQGTEQGTWTTYFKEGGVDSRGHYEHGIRVGLWIWWNRQGQLAQVGQYKPLALKEADNSALSEIKIDDGSLSAQRPQKASTSNQPRVQEQRTGLWLSWHTNCHLRNAGYYKDGDREGLWRWWKEDGQGWRAENYQKSRSQGRTAIPKTILRAQAATLQTLCQSYTPKTKELSKKLKIELQKDIIEQEETKALKNIEQTQDELKNTDTFKVQKKGLPQDEPVK